MSEQSMRGYRPVLNTYLWPSIPVSKAVAKPEPIMEIGAVRGPCPIKCGADAHPKPTGDNVRTLR